MSSAHNPLLALIRSPRGLRSLEKQARETTRTLDNHYVAAKSLVISGAVSPLEISHENVAATVCTSTTCSVRLELIDGALSVSCDCEDGQAGLGCAHAIAVAMRSYLDVPPQANQSADWPSRSLTALRTTYFTLSPLIKDEWQQSLDQALQFSGDYDRDTRLRVSAKTAACVDALAARLQGGSDAAMVAHLAQYGFNILAWHIADTHGADSELHGEMDRLQWLHLDACKLAPPPPHALAQCLLDLELNYVLGLRLRITEFYNEILGERGQETYRQFVQSAWETVFGPQYVDTADYAAYRRRLKNLMLLFAGEDIEARIAIKSRDLTYPADFIDVINLSREAGNSERALRWAEQACGEFDIDDLRELRAECLQDLDRHDEALAIVWAEYAASPNVYRYQTLQHHAQRAERWPEWRERALDWLRERIATVALFAPNDESFRTHTGNSELVQIFLYEKDQEAAWREATQGGCDRYLWLELAKTHEKSAPEDALRIYRDEVELELENTGVRFYRRAVRHLVRMKAILKRLDDAKRFDDLIDELRQKHKRRRALLALFDEKGW